MRLLKLLVCIALCSCFTVVAFAHPGRTDSNGGHTNRRTGEYHYHHGKPEHQHYDYDGDGDLDCPYSFDSKAGNSKQDSSEKPKKASNGYFKPIIGCLLLYGVVLLIDEIKWRL